MMMAFSKFDAADYLDSPEVVAAYFNEALETNDDAFIAIAIATIARIKGAKVASDVVRSLNGQSKPELDTVRKVLAALGVKLVVAPIENPKAA